MSEKVDSLRNIALVAHSGAGKTSLAEAMLYDSGVTNRLGRVEDGNTAMDFEPEELKRTSSISSGFHQFEWKKHTINIIDTPGDQNFFFRYLKLSAGGRWGACRHRCRRRCKSSNRTSLGICQEFSTAVYDFYQ